MSVHVAFETPEDVADKIYEMIQSNTNGRVKKGSKEEIGRASCRERV